MKHPKVGDRVQWTRRFIAFCKETGTSVVDDQGTIIWVKPVYGGVQVKVEWDNSTYHKLTIHNSNLDRI